MHFIEDSSTANSRLTRMHSADEPDSNLIKRLDQGFT